MTGEHLGRVLDAIGPAALAVSGGVDSTTLAGFVHNHRPGKVHLFHAISPAVPREATDRLRNLAAARGWPLTVFDAGEFADERYRANPVDRCFFCKTNLYSTIARLTDLPILSGTNCDDLGDFRPGLQAARDHRVRHPYVEAGMDKTAIYTLARDLGLTELADLPASPCLASRIETGLRVEVPALRAVEQAEAALRRRFGRRATLRCRLRAQEIGIELDAGVTEAMDTATRDGLRQEVAGIFRAAGIERPVILGTYRRGSAFLRGEAGSA